LEVVMGRRWVIVDDRLDTIYERAAQRLGDRAPSQRERAPEPRRERTTETKREAERERADPLLPGLRAGLGRFARLA
jgi:hypothetical protein